MAERGTAVAVETGKFWHAADMPIRLALVRKLDTCCYGYRWISKWDHMNQRVNLLFSTCFKTESRHQWLKEEKKLYVIINSPKTIFNNFLVVFNLEPLQFLFIYFSPFYILHCFLTIYNILSLLHIQLSLLFLWATESFNTFISVLLYDCSVSVFQVFH